MTEMGIEPNLQVLVREKAYAARKIFVEKALR